MPSLKVAPQISNDDIQSAVVGAVNDALVFGSFRKNALIFTLNATAFNGTILVEGSLDGVNWRAIAFHPLNSTSRPTQVANVALTSAATTLYLARVSGTQFVRIRCSAFTSATAAVIVGRTITGDVD